MVRRDFPALLGLPTDGYQKKKHIPFMKGSIVLVEYYVQIQKMRRSLLKADINIQTVPKLRR